MPATLPSADDGRADAAGSIPHAPYINGPAMSERNKEAARAEFEVWNTGELHRLDDLVAEDVVHHDPYDPRAAAGLAGLKETIEANRRAFPDLHITIEDQLAEGNRVATRWTSTMTHQGNLGGLAPTGNRATITGITIERFENGKVVESWRSMDMLGLMRDLGTLPG
jgi:steroid delta-isomerase-like uncharacterized protein